MPRKKEEYATLQNINFRHFASLLLLYLVLSIASGQRPSASVETPTTHYPLLVIREKVLPAIHSCATFFTTEVHHFLHINNNESIQ